MSLFSVYLSLNVVFHNLVENINTISDTYVEMYPVGYKHL